MRTDQYVGLTGEAKKFVATFLTSKDLTKTSLPSHMIKGAWNDIELGVWVGKEPLPNGKFSIYIEVVQDAPWSSGPMYFTYLAIDYQNGAEFLAFQWSLNLNMESGDFDIEKGEYNV